MICKLSERDRIFNKFNKTKMLSPLRVQIRSANKILLIIASLLQILVNLQLTAQLSLKSVHIPSLVQRGSNFWLACQFDLERDSSDEQLYSVKWYKNNEEFYRLMLAPASNSDPFQPAEVGAGQQQQQQYFAQSGVNVMMSGSNATHVRLLNASLESEGIYACEISTQNLSTIRYERNIRVYVLPNSRLNIIGFKNRYSLNERVELGCSSDFSRPQPALAWFINGRRISRSDQWFQLSQELRSKLNEANLFASSSSLKFKLTRDFLAAHLAYSSQQADSLQFASQPARLRANQSPKKWSLPGSVQHQHQENSSAYQLQSSAASSLALTSDNRQLELRIQCLYRLAEVSEVTYNELSVGLSKANFGQDSSSFRRATGRKLVGQRNHRQTTTRTSGAGVVVSKSSQSHQVMQSQSPASAKSLANFLASNYQEQLEQQCRLGSLALLPGDPLISAGNLDSPDSEILYNSSDEDQDQDQGTAEDHDGTQTDDRVERSSSGAIGQVISVNCSTVSGLLPSRLAQQRAWRVFRRSGPHCSGGAGAVPLAGSSDSRRRTPRPINTPNSVGRTTEPATDNNGPPPANERQPNQRLPNSQLLSSSSWSSSRGFFAAAHLWLERALELAPAQNDSQQLQQPPASADSSASDADGLLAPPLLEWFINNQEAPAAALTGYWPELPLLSPNSPQSTVVSVDGQLQQRQQQPQVPGINTGTNPHLRHNRPFRLGPHTSRDELDQVDLSYSERAPGGTRLAADHLEAQARTWSPNAPARGPSSSGGELLPSVDATEYFANFDNRPASQSLGLKLKLDKSHFITKDSKLSLKCSSTQAQILQADSATLLILPIVIDGSEQQQEQSAGRSQTNQQNRNQNNRMRNQARASSATRDQQKSSANFNARINFAFLIVIIAGWCWLCREPNYSY